MPVANTFEDVARFMSEEERKKESMIRLEEVRRDYDINLSVEEYKELIKTL